jgi:hypothetical protein
VHVVHPLLNPHHFFVSYTSVWQMKKEFTVPINTT